MRGPVPGQVQRSGGGSPSPRSRGSPSPRFGGEGRCLTYGNPPPHTHTHTQADPGGRGCGQYASFGHAEGLLVQNTGRARLIRSHSSAMFYFELSGNSNYKIHCNSNYRSDTANSNTVNSKFHLIRSLSEDFARFLSFHV